MGRSFPFYSLHCNAGAALAALKPTQTGSKMNRIMTKSTRKTPTPAFRKQGASKSMPAAVAKAATLNPLKTAKAAPSQEAIGTKAYEIWMSRGREQGQGQAHWFEAERQLQQG
jgi:hypothetical protein